MKFEHILVGIDSSEPPELASMTALELVRRAGALARPAAGAEAARLPLGSVAERVVRAEKLAVGRRRAVSVARS